MEVGAFGQLFNCLIDEKLSLCVFVLYGY